LRTVPASRGASKGSENPKTGIMLTMIGDSCGRQLTFKITVKPIDGVSTSVPLSRFANRVG